MANKSSRTRLFKYRFRSGVRSSEFPGGVFRGRLTGVGSTVDPVERFLFDLIASAIKYIQHNSSNNDPGPGPGSGTAVTAVL